MCLFPFFIDGYKFFNYTCTIENIFPCLSFRLEYSIKGTFTSIAFSVVLLLFIAFSMYRSHNESVQTHSLHAKIERRLIYQAIFSSIFQLLYFSLNYISSISTDGSNQYFFAYLAHLSYHLQHLALMITHFIFSPTFKNAFLCFYHLEFLSRDGKITNIKALSKSALTKISTPKMTKTSIV